MLQRSSQVGEFYRMSPPMVFDSTVDKDAEKMKTLASKALPSTYMGA